MIKNGHSSSLYMLTLFFACLLLSTLSGQALAIGSDTGCTVERTLLSSVSPGSEFEVQLKFSGFETGGIIETLPEGFTYLESSLPKTRVRVEGQNVIFALLEEDRVSYSVKAPASGEGIFSGEWEDVLEQKKGIIIGNSGIAVSSSGTSKMKGLEQENYSITEENSLQGSGIDGEKLSSSETGAVAGETRETVSKSENDSEADQKPGKLPFAGPGLMGGAIGIAAVFRGLEKSLKQKKGGVL